MYNVILLEGQILEIIMQNYSLNALLDKQIMLKAHIKCPDTDRRLQVRALVGIFYLLTHCSRICMGLKDQHSSQFPLHLCGKEKLVIYVKMVDIYAQLSNKITAII